MGGDIRLRIVAILTLSTNPPEWNHHLKEGLLERMRVKARWDQYIQQLMASQAIIAASSKKKDGTAVVSTGPDIVKSPSQSGNEQIKARALGGLGRLAEACRRFLIKPGKQSGLRKEDAEGLSYLA